MFGKKKKNEKSIDEIRFDEVENSSKQDVLAKGSRNLKDMIAPSCFDRGHESYMKVGNKYVRNFMLHGYPSVVYVSWLDNLYNYNGDMDVTLHIEPANEREALEQLTNKITQYESQLSIELEKGNIKDTTRIQSQIQELYRQRQALERNFESLFYLEVSANLFANSVEQLDKETQILDNKLKGRKINLLSSDLRQDDGYKTCSPYGKAYIHDCFRNMNTGALSGCFPFYNSEIMHESGVFCGVNTSTATPILIDFYDREKLYNSNINVFGQAGAGKSFFVKLLTARSALRGIRTVIIDPEGEYKGITKGLQGAYIEISTDSKNFINPMDIEEEEVVDDYGNITGEKVVNLKAKVADVLNLLEVMSGGLSIEQRSMVSMILMNTYNDFGFSENPESLYTKEEYFNEKTGEFYHVAKKKPMPRLSDFHKRLVYFAEQKNNYELIKIANGLTMFLEGGIYDLFDCYTSEDLANFKDAPLVTFDISKLEENILRPIGMYVAMSWCWEKFVKKNPHIKKRVICDEAWMLVNKNMAGFRYTSQFLENCSRRIRKRNGGLLIASQNFLEFANNEQGKAVLTNALTSILLRQDSSDIDMLQDTFKLSDGEKGFLLGARRGEILIKMAGQTAVAQVVPFAIEERIVTPEKFANPDNK